MRVDLNNYKDIFEPFEKLIEIKILGRIFEVPENNTLLRCFQYLNLDSISQGDFCWNRDCMNCQVWIEKDGSEKGLVACRALVEEGMNIVRLHEEIELFPTEESGRAKTETAGGENS